MPCRPRALSAVVVPAVALLIGCGNAGSAPPATTQPPAQAPGWPVAQAPPPGWHRATIASRAATLYYPRAWSALHGDTGTVSAVLRSGGLFHGYLNVTPREGAEQLAGWAGFRTHRNSAEGDGSVREVAAAEGLRFRSGAHGSCVIDDYRSRVGANPYRELACIVAGRRGVSVFVGAALQADWPGLAPLLRSAAGALLVR